MMILNRFLRIVEYMYKIVVIDVMVMLYIQEDIGDGIVYFVVKNLIAVLNFYKELFICMVEE